MTVINIDDEVGRYFEMDGGGKVKLRTMTADVLKAIRKQAVKKRVEFKKVEGTPHRFEWEDVNDELQNELFWDHIIQDWEGFTDGKGNPIPCTRDNKLKLMFRSVKFSQFITESLKTLADEEAKQLEASEKN